MIKLSKKPKTKKMQNSAMKAFFSAFLGGMVGSIVVVIVSGVSVSLAASNILGCLPNLNFGSTTSFSGSSGDFFVTKIAEVWRALV